MHLLKKVNLILSVLLISICLGNANAGSIALSKQTLIINHRTLTVEVAKTVEERQQGLMFRQHLANGLGMFFDFGEKVIPCFWMKDTYIPLSLAFINENHTITQIIALEPQDLKNMCSEQPIRYAIEVPQGWFAKHGIIVGMQVEGISHR